MKNLNYIFLLTYLLQVQDLGLQQSYRDDRGTHDFIRRVMALPCLPEDKIVPQFERLELRVTEEGNLRQFIQPSTWTVFLRSV